MTAVVGNNEDADQYQPSDNGDGYGDSQEIDFVKYITAQRAM